jgi:DNA repair exonuclease SbcCD ATPase subunit
LAVAMMAEGSETPNGEPGRGSQGRPRRDEGDLFAERRARHAAESGEAALTRRAEAAEATVQTLERHVASLQQRLREAEDERARVDELLEAERAAALEREHELRRIKQREYAEQQLRVEAEDRLASADRDSRAEIERLSVRLDASEREARELGLRLEAVQRQLAEAEQETGAERAAVRRSEQDLQLRLSQLERRASEIQRGLEEERAARERSERQLQSMREGHRRMEVLLGEMKGIVARVSVVLAAGEQAARAGASAPASATAAVAGVPPVAGEPRGGEMADALAAAVERLRARAASSPEGEAAPVVEQAAEPAVGRGQARADDSETIQDAVLSQHEARREPASRLPAHKHSLSWFGRQRIKRKQRRSQ